MVAWIGSLGHGFFEGAHLKEAPLPQGTVLIEYVHLPSGRPYNVVRARVRDPQPAGLTLRVDPCGTIRILLNGAGRDAAYVLPMEGVPAGARVILRYVWDTVAGTGVLAASVVEQGPHVTCALQLPVSFGAGDLGRLLRAAVVSDGTVIAVADAVQPVGPMPGICGAAQVRMADGLSRMDQVQQGDVLRAADGQPAQVRWAGHVDLPTCGHYAPTMIRAPQYGAVRDVLLGRHQPVVLGGTEVEYLFAAPSVTAAAGDLAIGADDAPPSVRRYYQLVLDRDVPMVVDGVPVPGLDIAPMRDDPVLAAHSVVAGLPPELMPHACGGATVSLMPFEARSLSRMRAAAQVPMLGVS